MTETKFTPGPWFAHYFEPAEEWSVCLETKNDQGFQLTIAEIESPCDADEANANLIAAAPELYEAAQLALIALTVDTIGTYDATEALRAALAKASGEPDRDGPA